MDWFLYDNGLRHERVNDGGLYRRESMDKLLCDRDLRHEQVQAVLTQMIMLLIWPLFNYLPF